LELKFEEWPDIPKDWIDFIAGVHPAPPMIPFAGNRQFLHSHLDRVRRNAFRGENIVRMFLPEETVRSDRTTENIRLLGQPETVVVVANIAADLLGGTFSQFLKCLTAVKICEMLGENGIPSVPLGWVCSSPRNGVSPGGPVRILDDESELQRLTVHPVDPGPLSSGDSGSFRRVPDLIAGIERIGRGLFDPEIINILRAAYASDAGRSACIRLLTNLMDVWGVIIVDARSAGCGSVLKEAEIPPFHNPGEKVSLKNNPEVFLSRKDCPVAASGGMKPEYIMQNRIFPVFACILAPHELKPFIEARPAIENCGLVPPFAWPVSSATIVDARSRRILDKYRFGLQDLFSGEPALLGIVRERVPRYSITEKLDFLKSQVERRMDALNDLDPEEDGFRKTKEACRERIVFQIDKMRRRVEAAALQKQQVMQRHIHRVCCMLAPDGASQECSLSGIYFFLRYPRTLLSSLHEQLDIMKFEHQLIYMD
jgi:hypothetical protein